MPDNGVGRGARRPVDVCSARTEAERRSNPNSTKRSSCFLKNLFNGKKREITPSKQYYKWTLANMHKKYSKICACLCTLKWDKMIL